MESFHFFTDFLLLFCCKFPSLFRCCCCRRRQSFQEQQQKASSFLCSFPCYWKCLSKRVFIPLFFIYVFPIWDDSVLLFPLVPRFLEFHGCIVQLEFWGKGNFSSGLGSHLAPRFLEFSDTVSFCGLKKKMHSLQLSSNISTTSTSLVFVHWYMIEWLFTILLLGWNWIHWYLFSLCLAKKDREILATKIMLTFMLCTKMGFLLVKFCRRFVNLFLYLGYTGISMSHLTLASLQNHTFLILILAVTLLGFSVMRPAQNACR